MYTDMENWAEIRRRALVDGLGKRAACREFDIHWDTLTKILRHPEPPGYRHTAPRPKPKLDPFLGLIHRILEDDRKAPRKQRHTTWRIFERLRDEHGYTRGLTVVKEAVATDIARSDWIGVDHFALGWKTSPRRNLSRLPGRTWLVVCEGIPESAWTVTDRRRPM